MGPQRHQVGGRGAVVVRVLTTATRSASPALRPDRAGVAAEVLAARSPMSRRSGSCCCGPPPRWGGHRTRPARLLPAQPETEQARAAALVAAGSWRRSRSTAGRTAYLLPGQSIPRRDKDTALLCPFDPLIFFRPGAADVRRFHYRIEIYTPAPKPSTATTCGRSCSTGGWWGVDLKRATAPARAGRVHRGRPGPCARPRGAGRELCTMAGLAGLDDVASQARGSVAPLRTALR